MNRPTVASNWYRIVLAVGVFGFLLVVLWGTAVSSASRSAPGLQAVGLFTKDQADRGSAVYATQCAFCHGQGLEGASSTPLAGPRFMTKWGDGKHSLDDLLFVTRTQMPYDAAGKLTSKEYVDVVAFILESNGYRAGNKALVDSLSLKQTMIAPQSGWRGPNLAAKSRNKRPKKEPIVIWPPALNGRPTQAQLNSAHANTTDWLMSNHDYGGQRFVDLKQINRQNVASLRPAATYQAADMNVFHTNPVISGGLMYITLKDSTIALDATTLKVRWRHDRTPKGKAGWGVNRGVAIKEGMVVRGTHDGYLIALDAATGELIWDRALVQMDKHEGGFTMAPVIFEDLIIIGPAGSELGVKGWVGAFKLSNGEEVWRFNTVPDDGEPGSETWERADAKMKGGGAVWTPLSLDVHQGLVYVPVANPAPDYFGEARPGNNLYTSSMVVLDVRTGKLEWFYQLVPHDLHDWDTTQAGPLFTTTIAGKTRRLVATAGKDGLLHVLDRDTREQVYEVPVTTRLNTELPLTREGVRACPGVLGGVQWNGPAYNPGTNMLYVNAVDWCGTFSKDAAVSFVAGQFYLGGSARLDAPDKSRGWLTAVDASTGAVRWKYESSRPMLAAVTTTSADLIFTGELLGDFLALDAETGAVLYRFNTGGRMNGGVVTYAINGKQYVAVATGAASSFWAVPPGSATIVLFALAE